MPTKQLDLTEHLAGFDYVPTMDIEPEPGVFVRTSKLAELEDLIEVFDKAAGRKVYIRSLVEVNLPGNHCWLLRSCYGRTQLAQS